MTDTNPPTHRPKPNSDIVHRGYTIGVQFHPTMNLGKGGYKFADAISEYLEARSVVLDQNQWLLSQPVGGTADSGLQLTITPNSFQFDASSPTHLADWYQTRCEMVLQVFGDMFGPKVSLDSVAKFSGIMDIDGDAREFLVKHVTSFDPNRFSLLKRPIHAFGIRVFCPPYEKITVGKGKGKKQTKETVSWHVDVKAESLLLDPTKLYLEAEAHWPEPGQWDQPKIKEIVGHLKTVVDYVSKDVIEFLKNPVSGGAQ